MNLQPDGAIFKAYIHDQQWCDENGSTKQTNEQHANESRKLHKQRPKPSDPFHFGTASDIPLFLIVIVPVKLVRRVCGGCV
jgi:hypothetical protein